MFIEAPSGYPKNAKRLMKELGIDTDRFYDYFDQELFSSLGLKRGLFFDKETFGADHLAVGNMFDPEMFTHSPLSAQGQADLVRLFKDELPLFTRRTKGKTCRLSSQYRLPNLLGRPRRYGR